MSVTLKTNLGRVPLRVYRNTMIVNCSYIFIYALKLVVSHILFAFSNSLIAFALRLIHPSPIIPVFLPWLVYQVISSSKSSAIDAPRQPKTFSLFVLADTMMALSFTGT